MKTSFLHIALLGLVAGFTAPVLADVDQTTTQQANSAQAQADLTTESPASMFHNPVLMASIRVQGKQASAAIAADTKISLLSQVRTQPRPALKVASTGLVEYVVNTGASSVQLDQELWLKALMSASEPDLFHTL